MHHKRYICIFRSQSYNTQCTKSMGWNLLNKFIYRIYCAQSIHKSNNNLIKRIRIFKKKSKWTKYPKTETKAQWKRRNNMKKTTTMTTTTTITKKERNGKINDIRKKTSCLNKRECASFVHVVLLLCFFYIFQTEESCYWAHDGLVGQRQLMWHRTHVFLLMKCRKLAHFVKNWQISVNSWHCKQSHDINFERIARTVVRTLDDTFYKHIICELNDEVMCNVIICTHTMLYFVYKQAERLMYFVVALKQIDTHRTEKNYGKPYIQNYCVNKNVQEWNRARLCMSVCPFSVWLSPPCTSMAEM